MSKNEKVKELLEKAIIKDGFILQYPYNLPDANRTPDTGTWCSDVDSNVAYTRGYNSGILQALSLLSESPEKRCEAFKPCPFCGGEDIRIVDGYGYSDVGCWVVCKSCGAQTGAEEWNFRAARSFPSCSDISVPAKKKGGGNNVISCPAYSPKADEGEASEFAGAKEIISPLIEDLELRIKSDIPMYKSGLKTHKEYLIKALDPIESLTAENIDKNIALTTAQEEIQMSQAALAAANERIEKYKEAIGYLLKHCALKPKREEGHVYPYWNIFEDELEKILGDDFSAIVERKEDEKE